VPPLAVESITVAPVFSVTTSHEPAWTVSVIVAVMVIVRPAPYVPAAELVEKPVTTGDTVSIEIGGDNSPTTFPFRAGSVNVPAATETDPADVELAVGVKVAV
jgi:hypothetical protein